jgi:hypothetical protein
MMMIPVKEVAWCKEQFKIQFQQQKIQDEVTSCKNERIVKNDILVSDSIVQRLWGRAHLKINVGVSIGSNKANDKIQHHFMIKALIKQGIERIYLNIIRDDMTSL